MNIIVYAISSRTGGGYSVLSDFYNEVSRNAENYADIKWIFILSTQKFKETESIKIINQEDSVKTLLHRAYFNSITMKKIIREYNAEAIISLQNMGVLENIIPNIVCLHNVLPLYKCNKDVLDTFLQRIKQCVVNGSIRKSLKRAYKVFVASEWIKDALIEKVGVDEKKIIVSKVNIPNNKMQKENVSMKKNIFFYPAAPLPYKNHKVILGACKILKEANIEDFEIQFTFDKDQSKTAKKLYEIVEKENLNVSFVGGLPREEVLESYRSKILLFPSKIENDAMPLIECVQFGGYVLSVDLPYAKDILEFYSAKNYFMPDDEMTLAKLMKEIILEGIHKDIEHNAKQMSNESRLKEIVNILRTLK